MSDEETPTGSQPTRVTRGGDPNDSGDEGGGFAGMPGSGTKVGAGQRMGGGMAGLFQGIRDANEDKQSGRWNMEFTLSKDILSDDYVQAGFEDKHLKFKIVELKPAEEERAATNAGGGMKIQAHFGEMVKASLLSIGGVRVSYDDKEKWLDAIGPKSRKQVDRCFNSVNGLEDKEGEDILATAKSGRG